MSVPAKVQQNRAVAAGLADMIARYLDEKLAEPIAQISNLDGRVQDIEKRLSREGLTRAQGRQVQRTVATKVKDVAKHFPDVTEQQHFANIYGSLKDKYNVPSYLDIPRDRFLEVIDLVNTYDGSGRNWWAD